jgi:hypothetical protein
MSYHALLVPTVAGFGTQGGTVAERMNLLLRALLLYSM